MLTLSFFMEGSASARQHIPNPSLNHFVSAEYSAECVQPLHTREVLVAGPGDTLQLELELVGDAGGKVEGQGVGIEGAGDGDGKAEFLVEALAGMYLGETDDAGADGGHHAETLAVRAANDGVDLLVLHVVPLLESLATLLPLRTL